jgi:acyl carrier protein
MSVEKKILHTIAEQLGINEDEIDKDASLIDDMGADSLDIVELVMAMEEEFEMEIPDEDAEKISTVQDIIDYVQQRLKEAKK